MNSMDWIERNRALEWSTGASKMINFDLNITSVAIWLTDCANFKVIITMTIVFHYRVSIIIKTPISLHIILHDKILRE